MGRNSCRPYQPAGLGSRPPCNSAAGCEGRVPRVDDSAIEGATYLDVDSAAAEPSGD